MIMNTASGMMESEDRTMILGGPKDTIASLWTKGLKALVPPNSFGPPPMGGVGVDFKDRATDCHTLSQTATYGQRLSLTVTHCHRWPKTGTHCHRLAQIATDFH